MVILGLKSDNGLMVRHLWLKKLLLGSIVLQIISCGGKKSEQSREEKDMATKDVPTNDPKNTMPDTKSGVNSVPSSSNAIDDFTARENKVLASGLNLRMIPISNKFEPNESFRRANSTEQPCKGQPDGSIFRDTDKFLENFISVCVNETAYSFGIAGLPHHACNFPNVFGALAIVRNVKSNHPMLISVITGKNDTKYSTSCNVLKLVFKEPELETASGSGATDWNLSSATEGMEICNSKSGIGQISVKLKSKNDPTKVWISFGDEAPAIEFLALEQFKTSK